MRYRIAMHERRPASLVEVEHDMSAADVLEVCEFLDAFDEAQRRAYEEARGG
jgi:hypothetical protein